MMMREEVGYIVAAASSFFFVGKRINQSYFIAASLLATAYCTKFYLSQTILYFIVQELRLRGRE